MWDNWDKACEFWRLLGEQLLQPVRDALAAFVNEDGEYRKAEKVAIICKAWTQFAQGHELTDEGLRLKYADKSGDGIMRLAECPTVGGIDLGNPPEDDDAGIAEEGETPAEAATPEK